MTTLSDLETSPFLMSRLHDAVIHCPDAIRRHGLATIFGDASPPVVPWFSTRNDVPIPRPAKVLIVLPDSERSGDRFRCLQQLPADSGPPPRPVGVAVCRMPLDLVLVLRLVESGISHVVDYGEAAQDPSVLVALHDEVAERHRLPPAAALRRRLGLRPDGNLREFCRLAAALPPAVWLDDERQSRLPITRRQVMRIRQQARDVAGMPPPDGLRYSTLHRSSPTTPAWTDVRDVVHRLWGLRTDRDHLLP